MSIGENIRYFRKQANLTQKQLADLSGVHEVTIRGYETGKFKPKTENLSKLCNALGCSINDILEVSKPSSGDSPLDSSRYERIVNKIQNKMDIDSADLQFLCNDCIQEYYQSLNPDGQKQADQMVSDLLKNLQLLSRIPEYKAGESSGKSSGNDTKKGTK